MTQDLIERLERGPAILTSKEAYDLAITFGSDTALGLSRVIQKAFTGTSLDAALALVERVLPGWHWSLSSIDCIGPHGIPEKAVAEMGPLNWSDDPRVPPPENIIAGASTPALALCIALLRAHREGEGR